MDNFSNGIGIWQIISSNLITDIIAKAGFDITLIDFEHGFNDPKTLQNIVFAAKSNNILSIARLPNINYPNISQIIDTGVDGILFPHVEEKSQLDNIIKETLLHPLGSRGYSPFVPRFDYGLKKNSGSKDISIGVIIESIRGVENIEEILKSPIIDFIYFGAYDLSVELGKPGQIFSEEVIESLKIVTNLSNSYNKRSMAIYRNKSELEFLIKLDISFPIASVDTNILLNALINQKEIYENLIN